MIYSTEFTIKKLNKEKILKQVLSICPIHNIKTNEENFCFTISNKYKKNVEDILNKKNIKIINKQSKGLLSFFKRTILRLGVIIPICFFVILVFISNMYVFNYQILGNQRVTDGQVYEVLKANNVYGIINKKSIDKNKLEDALLGIDSVSLVSIILKGNTLIINIKEKVYNPEFEEKNEFVPLISEHNGVITELNVIQGTPLVKVGQTVKQGQKLVAPYVMDTSGQQLAVKPMADIKADVFLTTISQEPNTKIQMVDTGNVYRNKTISLFGINLYNNSKECPYKNYRTETEIVNMGDNLILPIKMNITKYYEQKEIVLENYFSNNKEQILLDCQQKTRQLITSCDIIKDEYNVVTTIADVNQITYTIVVNKSIC